MAYSYGEALKIAVGLPKCEIHMHLDGSLLPSFLFERASARGIRDKLPATAFELRTMIDKMKIEMRKQPSGGHSGVESGKNWPLFDLMNNFLQTEYELETASYLLASHLREVHNVKVLELRFCPSLHTVEGLSELEAVQAVSRGLAKAESEAIFFRAGVIVCALRSYPAPHAIQLAQLASENLRYIKNTTSNMVVGFDIAGSEQFPLTLPHIKEALILCVKNNVPLTVHAGEIPTGTYDNLELALSLPVQRIGHGAALAFDQVEAENTFAGSRMTSLEMMSKVAELGITVEVCLTAITTPAKGIPSYQDHPIHCLLQAGVKCALSCDNLLLSGDPNTAGPVDYSSSPTTTTSHSINAEQVSDFDDPSACYIPGGLGVSYAHPSGEIGHLVADCNVSWKEAREIVLNGVKTSFCLGMHMTEERQLFISKFEEELDSALMKAGVY